MEDGACILFNCDIPMPSDVFGLAVKALALRSHEKGVLIIG